MRQEASHASRVECALDAGEAAQRSIVASWQRSSSLHKINPDRNKPPERLTSSEMGEVLERYEEFIENAGLSLDHLYQTVADSGCSVLLADANGVVIARRGAVQDDKMFNEWGLWTGAIWSEKSEGTNGIGTCIVEKRALTVHKGQHFQTKNIELSCSAAPIFDHEGRLICVVDVSSCRRDLSAGFYRLISYAIRETANRIETSHFRKKFNSAKIVMAPLGPGAPPEDFQAHEVALLALDQDELVIGATRGARRVLGLHDGDLKKPLLLSTLNGQELNGQALNYAEYYHSAARRSIQHALAHTGGNVSAAARMLGISRATLHRKIKQFGLTG